MLRGAESGPLPAAPPILRVCVWALADIYTGCWCFLYETVLWEQPGRLAVVALGWLAYILPSAPEMQSCSLDVMSLRCLLPLTELAPPPRRTSLSKRQDDWTQTRLAC